MSVKKVPGIRLMKPSDFYNWDYVVKGRYVDRVRKYIAKTNHALFQRMEEIVRKDLSSYQNDFYVHDFYELIDFDGDAIWMTRDSGTDLAPLLDDEQRMMHCKEWFHAVKGYNKQFYLLDCKNKTIERIPMQKAERIMEKHLEKFHVSA